MGTKKITLGPSSRKVFLALKDAMNIDEIRAIELEPGTSVETILEGLVEAGVVYKEKDRYIGTALHA